MTGNAAFYPTFAPTLTQNKKFHLSSVYSDPFPKRKEWFLPCKHFMCKILDLHSGFFKTRSHNANIALGLQFLCHWTPLKLLISIVCKPHSIISTDFAFWSDMKFALINVMQIPDPPFINTKLWYNLRRGTKTFLVQIASPAVSDVTSAPAQHDHFHCRPFPRFSYCQ